MHTLSPIPENMKRPIVFPFPIPSPEERIFRLPPMEPQKKEKQKERWEREERIRRDAEKSEKNRITITSGIETENDKDTLKKGKGKVLR